MLTRLELPGVLSLPDSISQLSALRELDLCRWSLTGLPQGLTACQQLTWLSMESDYKCPVLSSLQSMRYLRVTANGQDTYWTQLTALTELQLTRGTDASIPPELGGISSLRKLRLESCGCMQLHAGPMLSHLESMCLCNVSGIPASLAAATQLRELSVIRPSKIIPADLAVLLSSPEDSGI